MPVGRELRRRFIRRRGEERLRERFESEIESLKKLHHPSIVQLYGYGEQDEVLFYAMELVEGVSLEEELTHGQ